MVLAQFAQIWVTPLNLSYPDEWFYKNYLQLSAILYAVSRSGTLWFKICGHVTVSCYCSNLHLPSCLKLQRQSISVNARKRFSWPCFNVIELFSCEIGLKINYQCTHNINSHLSSEFLNTKALSSRRICKIYPLAWWAGEHSVHAIQLPMGHAKVILLQELE